MTVLLDTNIISELVRPEPNVGVLAWYSSISRIFISVITLDEISYGLTAKPNLRVQALCDRYSIVVFIFERQQQTGYRRLRTQFP
jgi:toxin FitB